MLPVTALPGPRSALLTTLSAFRDPYGIVKKYKQQYGDPLLLTLLGDQKLVVTSDPDAVRAIFTAPTEQFTSGVSDIMVTLLGRGSLLLLSGERHRAMRKVLAPPFNGARMRVYGQQICNIAVAQTEDLLVGSRFVTQERMRTITLQLIMQIVFGITEPQLLAELEKRLKEFLQSAGPLAFVLPKWELGGLSPYGRLVRARRQLVELLKGEIAAFRKSPRERTDIFGMLMTARYEDGSQIPDDELCDQLFTLLAAGFLTTATALSWAFYFLGKDPALRQRLTDALALLGPSPDPEVIAQAPLLEAVCNEALRIRPQVVGPARKLLAPMTIKGYEVPPGYSVGVNMLWIHFDPAIYPEPDTFKPERFLGRTYSPFEFMPFGGGFRRCIGAALAMYEMKLVLATLLRRFEFKLLTPGEIRVVQGSGALEPAESIRQEVTAVRTA